MLRCPVCKEALIHSDKKFVCMNHHSFDQAKQGYVNLSLKQKKNQGDNKQMVKARTEFLEKNYYDFMRQKVVQILKEKKVDTLVDMGCGQGYYTSAFQSVCKEVYGFDLSKEALAYAARQNKEIQYAVASIFDLPIDNEQADVVTSLFVPDTDSEVLRILKQNGLWITVGPGKKHCWELKELLYENVLENPEANKEKEGFILESQEILRNVETVNDVWSLLEMTPYRYKSPKEGLDRVKACVSLDVTFEFVISCWRKK